MTVRTARLFAATSNPSATTNTVYTCPAGRTTILKDLRVVTSAGTPTSGIVMLTSGGVDVSIIKRAWGANDVEERQGFMVLEPGDRIRVFAATGELKLWGSGSELDGVAP